MEIFNDVNTFETVIGGFIGVLLFVLWYMSLIITGIYIKNDPYSKKSVFLFCGVAIFMSMIVIVPVSYFIVRIEFDWMTFSCLTRLIISITIACLRFIGQKISIIRYELEEFRKYPYW